MRCDRIFVIENGSIIEEGSHSELISRKGRYFELWKDQLPENYADDQGTMISSFEEGQGDEICMRDTFSAYPVFIAPVD